MDVAGIAQEQGIFGDDVFEVFEDWNEVDEDVDQSKE